MTQRWVRAWTFGCIGLSCLACGSAASNLHSESIGKDEAPIIGHVEVREGGKDITSHCYADFVDRAGLRQAHVSLDDSGWIMTTVTPGKTLFAGVICPRFGPPAIFATREIVFDALGSHELAYFGHLHVEMHAEGFWEGFAKSGAGGIAPMLIVYAAEGNSKRQRSVARLEENLDQAIAHFRSQYPSSTLRPIIALRPSALRPSQPVTEEGVVRAEMNLASTRLHWLGLPARDAEHATLRIERTVSKAELGDCRELRATISGREPLAYHLSHKPPRRDAMNIVESVEARVDLSVVQALESDANAALDLCGVHLAFDAAADSSLHDFVTKFARKPAAELSAAHTDATPAASQTQ